MRILECVALHSEPNLSQYIGGIPEPVETSEGIVTTSGKASQYHCNQGIQEITFEEGILDGVQIRRFSLVCRCALGAGEKVCA